MCITRSGVARVRARARMCTYLKQFSPWEVIGKNFFKIIKIIKIFKIIKVVEKLACACANVRAHGRMCAHVRACAHM